MFRKILIFIFLFVTIAGQGCSTKKMATRVISSISSDGMVSLENEEDVEFAREASPALIKIMEVLRYGDKKDKTSLTLLSKAYGQYAFGFLEEDILKYKRGSDKYNDAYERAELFYRRGKEYGIAALINKSYMKKAFNSPFPVFQKAVNKLGKNYVPAMFWTAFNWANWLNMKTDDPSAIVELPRIEALINRVIELDGDFYYGSAHAIAGTIAASRPPLLGGNPTLAKKEYVKAMKISPHYLMTKVLFAQYYARQVQDEDLFKKELNEVLDADISKLQEQKLANNLAKKRAKLLLKKKNKLF